MAEIALGLIVLRAGDLDTSLAFYRALGLTFQEEKHGSGPIHYSCTLGSVVMELYPGTAGAAPEYRSSGATMLGFQVPSLEQVLTALEQIGTKTISAPKTTAWGRRADVQDPDGRAIELSEPLLQH